MSGLAIAAVAITYNAAAADDDDDLPALRLSRPAKQRRERGQAVRPFERILSGLGRVGIAHGSTHFLFR